VLRLKITRGRLLLGDTHFSEGASTKLPDPAKSIISLNDKIMSQTRAYWRNVPDEMDNVGKITKG
jgi:hypothetical protein